MRLKWTRLASVISISALISCTVLTPYAQELSSEEYTSYSETEEAAETAAQAEGEKDVQASEETTAAEVLTTEEVFQNQTEESEELTADEETDDITESEFQTASEYYEEDYDDLEEYDEEEISSEYVMSEEELYQYLVDFYLKDGATADEAHECALEAISNGYQYGMEPMEGIMLLAAPVNRLSFTATDLMREAATRIGAYYLWGRKGYYTGSCKDAPGTTTSIGSMPACTNASTGGYDCSGYVFDVLKHFGITMRYYLNSSEIAMAGNAQTGLPISTYGWHSIKSRAVNLNVFYDNEYVTVPSAAIASYGSEAAFEAAVVSGKVQQGDICLRRNAYGGHVVFYLGRFECREDVRDYMTDMLGVPNERITENTLFEGNGIGGGKYWFMEAIGDSTTTSRQEDKRIRVANVFGSTAAYTYTVFHFPNLGEEEYVPIDGVLPAEPSVSEIKISDETPSGYTVTAVFDAPAGVRQVLMPTWTVKNGQDDLVWHKAVVSGNTAVFRVKTADHNNEVGKYITHVYVYDRRGRSTVKGAEITVPDKYPVPSVKKVTVSNITPTGYKVTAEISAPAGLKQVLMPTWTDKNGQDDLVWHKASVSGNLAVFNVKTSDHKNESGMYYTHVYVYDNNDKTAVSGQTVNVPQTAGPAISDVAVSNVTEDGYDVSVKFTAVSGVKEVFLPTWTDKNGQDDIIWHKAAVSGNTAAFRVKTSDHRNEGGVYYTHVYVYDKNGRFAIKASTINVPQKAVTAIKELTVSNVTASGYDVSVNFTAAAGVKEVLMPTWTTKNGQDDIVWHKASVSGNTARFHVKVSDHRNESGEYNTHVYVYDNKGGYALDGRRISVPAASGAPVINSVSASEISSSGYTLTITFTAPAGVRELLLPSWSTAGGQDDIIWHKASVSGGKAVFRVKTSEHKNGRGEYITHVYLTDNKGVRAPLKGINVIVP